MRKHLLLIAAVFVSASCGDSSGPGGGHPGLTLIGGYNLTDTIDAQPVKALVVEVRDDRGAIVPRGTQVRFLPVGTSFFQSEMLVGALTSTSYATLLTGETDGAGRASVMVQMGTKSGPARIAVFVPTLGLQDTARYTVLPGQPAAIHIMPGDTAVYAGSSYTIRGGVVDRWDNARTDPVVYTATPGASVTSSGAVTASTIGRYTLTATAGSLSATTHFSVVPQGTVAAMIFSDPGFHIVTFNLDGSGFHDVVGAADGGIGPRPRWVPGTSTIIYTDHIAGFEQLRMVDANGNVSVFFPSPPQTMTHNADASPSAGAPVLYFSAYDSRCSYFGYCLFRSGIDGSNPEIFDIAATYEKTWHPAASPDGSKAAYVTGAYITDEIKVFDYATRTVSAWTVTGDYPTWSPDGTQIAYAELSGGRLHFMNADGTNQRVLAAANGPYSDSPPAWSPDSKWVIAENLGSGSLDLIEVATGTVLPISNPGGYFGVSWK
jgi:hypothetical protein